MKKVIPAIAAAFLLSSCIINTFPGFATPTALIQPTGSSTPLPTQIPSSSPTPVLLDPTATSALQPITDTPHGDILPPSPSPSAIIATSTELPINPTITETATLVPSGPSLTPTNGIMLYGTLPPAVPFNTLTIWNRSHVEAYISLQVTMNDGRFSIIEYPVKGQIRIKAPLGRYVYVAWVGGNKLTGGFRLGATDNIVITLFRDKVVIK